MNGWAKSLVAPLTIGNKSMAAVAGESAVSMMKTVLPGIVQDCRLSASPWNGSAAMPTHRPLGIPSGVYSSWDAVKVP